MTKEVEKYLEEEYEFDSKLEIYLTPKDMVDIAESVSGVQVGLEKDSKGSQELVARKGDVVSKLDTFVDSVASYALKELIKLKLTQITKPKGNAKAVSYNNSGNNKSKTKNK